MATLPNIFTYATSELSQDAWICWLVAHVDCDERPELRDAARDFVARLWNQARPGDDVTAADIGELRAGDPARQVEHIDVLFELRVRDRRVVFVIEDKTDSSHHSGQLARYAAKIQGLRRDAEPVLVYFKTGYHFDHDVAAREASYAVVGLDEVIAFVRAHPEVTSDVFRDYARHHAGVHDERRRLLAALDEPHAAPLLDRDFVQHAFLARLRDRCGGANALSRGANRDGTPWTHWCFSETPNALADGVAEYLFHRIDKRKNDGVDGYYLSTRQYADMKRAPHARPIKVERLRRYQRAFAEAIAISGTPLRVARVSGDHRGASESEIGVLFFGADQDHTIVLEHFPTIHRAFVERMRAGA